MPYRKRASTRPLFGRRTRVPPSPSRGRTSARHTEVCVMLLHLPHFCNSLFALPLMPWPAHGARRAAGQWRRHAAWSARGSHVSPGCTRRIPGCVSQHASPAASRRVPTSTRQWRPAGAARMQATLGQGRSPWAMAVTTPTCATTPGAGGVSAWLSPRRCTANPAGRPRGVSRRVPSLGAWAVRRETVGDPRDGHAAHQETVCRHRVGCGPSWARRERQAFTRTWCAATRDRSAYLQEPPPRTYGRPGCVPTGDAPRTYGRRISP
jgi:hypothetical protein